MTTPDRTDPQSLELDRDTRIAAHFMVMMGLLISNGTVRYALDTVVNNVLLAFFTGWNIFAVPLPLIISGHVRHAERLTSASRWR